MISRAYIDWQHYIHQEQKRFTWGQNKDWDACVFLLPPSITCIFYATIVILKTIALLLSTFIIISIITHDGYTCRVDYWCQNRGVNDVDIIFKSQFTQSDSSSSSLSLCATLLLFLRDWWSLNHHDSLLSEFSISSSNKLFPIDFLKDLTKQLNIWYSIVSTVVDLFLQVPPNK